MVCNEVGVTGGAVGVPADDVDDGGLFGAVGCGGLDRWSDTVSRAH